MDERGTKVAAIIEALQAWAVGKNPIEISDLRILAAENAILAENNFVLATCIARINRLEQELAYKNFRGHASEIEDQSQKERKICQG